ncbi:tetratricopeptide repeat protein [Brevundimonas sp. KM4]|uniref:tetratricopeptide repeat protein n=1 Tax=Brevundimonas sp. KM4 TaxID=1628191 RepID=UPI0009E51880|nr:tetratricopeptide repeat protein [Brevundimonas sp. KM4]
MKRLIARLYRRAQKALLPSVVTPREHARRGDLARDQGDWARAREHYLTAVALDPSLAAIWVQLGHAHKIELRTIEAESAYRQALLLDDSNADTWLQLGHILKIQGRFDEARESYEHSAALSPNSSYAFDEAVSLGSSVTALEQARREFARARKMPRYKDRAIGPGKLLLDLTGALDYGQEVALAITASLKSQHELVDVVLWRDGLWYDLSGLAFEFPESYGAIIVAGPGSFHRPDHMEAALHEARSRDIPILAGLVDLPHTATKNSRSAGADDASAHYFYFMNEVASGAITFLGLADYDARDTMRSIPDQVVSIPMAPFSQRSVDSDGPILVFGPADSQAMTNVNAALALLSPEMRSLFAFSTTLTDLGEELRVAGVLLTGSDPETRLCGLLVASQGLPLALSARQGLGGIAFRADMRLATNDIPEIARQLSRFAALCESRKFKRSSVPIVNRNGSIDILQKWKVRTHDGTAEHRLCLFEGHDFRFIHDIDARISIDPRSLGFLKKDGLSLTNTPIKLGIISGPEDIIARLLIVAPCATDKVFVRVGSNPTLVERSLRNGSMSWLQVNIVRGQRSQQITVCGEQETEEKASKLLAIYLHPASRADEWNYFLDQISRGQHPKIRSVARQLAGLTA